MNRMRTTAREIAEDLFFGQEVLLWARWFLIGAVTILALWTASDSTQLALAALPIAALMAMNFYLHARHALERPANRAVVTAAGLIDVSIITAIVAFWTQDTVAAGLGSPFFILYYPALLAFAFVFPARETTLYVGLTLTLYLVACLFAPVYTTAPIINTPAELKDLILRLITMGAMGGLGTFYWRIQRRRRRAAAGDPVPRERVSRLEPR